MENSMRLCILTLGSKGLKKDVRRRKLAGTRKIKLTGTYMYASPDKISSLLISLCCYFATKRLNYLATFPRNGFYSAWSLTTKFSSEGLPDLDDTLQYSALISSATFKALISICENSLLFCTRRQFITTT